MLLLDCGWFLLLDFHIGLITLKSTMKMTAQIMTEARLAFGMK